VEIQPRFAETLRPRLNLQRHSSDEGAVREVRMTDAQAATDTELAAAVAPPIQAEREERMPLAFIVFGCLALVVQVLWLGLIGWWLLNSF
jgi:hypothetical protein